MPRVAANDRRDQQERRHQRAQQREHQEHDDEYGRDDDAQVTGRGLLGVELGDGDPADERCRVGERGDGAAQLGDGRDGGLAVRRVGEDGVELHASVDDAVRAALDRHDPRHRPRSVCSGSSTRATAFRR
ncbi:MAG: hypothetical protein ABS81_17030 [Pseudonocardia sp. SCN 72-86]|nr:MAG: hypothetical protein ABS81_17030 [Pseudonocardia sp. SCN 72-86]